MGSEFTYDELMDDRLMEGQRLQLHTAKVTVPLSSRPPLLFSRVRRSPSPLQSAFPAAARERASTNVGEAAPTTKDTNQGSETGQRAHHHSQRGTKSGAKTYTSVAGSTGSKAALLAGINRRRREHVDSSGKANDQACGIAPREVNDLPVRRSKDGRRQKCGRIGDSGGVDRGRKAEADARTKIEELDRAFRRSVAL